jgi:hypothetical protein
MELMNQLVRGESFSERQNTLDNQRIMIDRQNENDNTDRLAESQNQMLRLDYAVQKRDSIEKLSGENRVKAMEALKSSKPKI